MIAIGMRAFAALIGIGALAALVVQILGQMQANPGTSALETIWVLLRYFTIWTNLSIGIFFALSAMRARLVSYSLLSAIVIWILVVGVAYHVLLARVHNPTGVLALTNEIFHTIIPIAVLAFWAMVRERANLSITDPLKWIFFPAAYGACAIARGGLDGVFPYYYMDPGIVGWSGVVASQLQFLLVFLGLGFGIRWLSNRLGAGSVR